MLCNPTWETWQGSTVKHDYFMIWYFMIILIEMMWSDFLCTSVTFSNDFAETKYQHHEFLLLDW